MTITSIPDIHSKYFIRKAGGGYSPCIKGNKALYDQCTLNNCVGAAWGLFAMDENNPKCYIGFLNRNKSSFPYDAGRWWNNGKSGTTDTYIRSSEPCEGAIICYKNHVAYVSSIAKNGDLKVLTSGYGSSNANGLWWKTVLKASGYEWPTASDGAGKFQGFILPTQRPYSEGVILVAKEVMAGKYGNAPERKDNLYNEIQSCVNYLSSK